MVRQLGYGLLLLAFYAGAQDADQDWQATLTLQSIAGKPLPSPVEVVPKQSIQMTATVWMPEKVNWFPQYPDWDMPGATIIPQFMLSPSIERQQSRFMQRGATQNYLVTPVSSGQLTLTQRSLRVYPDRDTSPELTLPRLTLTVALPPGAKGFDSFLPSTAVKLTQYLTLMKADGTEEELDAQTPRSLTLTQGQMLKRQIVIAAQGIQGAMIPMPVSDPQASSQETLTTDLTNYDEFLGGTRTLTRYYAPTKTEQITLQPVEVRWYDTVKRTFLTASLKGYRFKNAAPVATSRGVTLTLWEKVGQLTWQQGLPWATGLLILLILVLKLPAIIRASKKPFRRFRTHIVGSERYAFIRLCTAVLISGVTARPVLRAYQRWSIMRHRQAVTSDVVREWLHAVYGKRDLPPPGKVRLVRALIAQRRATHPRKEKTLFQPVALPAFTAVADGKAP